VAAVTRCSPSTAPGIALCSLVLALSTACAVSNVPDRQGEHPNAYGIDLYEPFDNSREWGPPSLVGPPTNAEEYPKSDFHRAPGTAIRLAPPAGSAPSIPSDPSNRSQP